ncbi:MarR family winged helix-turn-helix transcriptional regulator [Nocardia sp. NBC_01503]|uniref:MarR family winged helix-turn-helix transcriptional regulator n=1 Tax=Nocardia sp. NBC_01503 TaxID=2975997 RepID=UPI002E7B38CE|nr:MarR family winged helix-turn-helix transcriptional regulator [Nocardia sp. NBC_01503]WTL34269.1 MarR family winged helix-turn-helix transcriptional regulator [Nocardia sp. NBC_01503]
MVKSLTNLRQDRPLPLGNLLNAAARTLAAELDAGLAAAGFSDLRAAHAPIFQAIDPGGTRLADLAARIGVTKQAMSEPIRHLETQAYIEVMPDPVDKRARLVRLTPKGESVVTAGMEVVNRFDAQLDSAIGAAEVARMRQVLTKIINGAGRTPH